MSSTTTAAQPRRGTSTVAVASLVSAGAGYVVMLVSARTLTPAANAEFLSWWALLFGLFGVLAGVQNETTRGVRAARHVTGSAGASRPSVLPWGLAVGCALAAPVAASSPWWGPSILGDRWVLLTVALCVGVVAFAGHCAVAGALGGMDRWPTFSLLVGSEATVRLALVLLAAAVGLGIAGLEVASAVAAATWLGLVVLSPHARRAARAVTDVPRGPFLRQTGIALAAAAATAVLVVGFPVAVRGTSSVAEYATAAPLLLAVSLTRAPLLIPLNAYQGVAIAHFVSAREHPGRSLLRLAGALVGVGLVGSVLAAAVGPWLMRTLFGPAYDVEPWLLGVLTLGATALAVLTMTGAATLAVDRHLAYAGGWVIATVTGIAALLLPVGLDERVALGLLVGPVLGTVVHLVTLVRYARGLASTAHGGR